MDKRVIFAVAGSGKTSHIIDKLTEDSKTLILTYTDNNLTNIKQRVLYKFGEIPKGIKIYSYFHFLYSFCMRPLLGYKIKTKGINWQTPPEFTQRLKRNNIKFYLDNHQRVYSNRIAKLLEQCTVTPEVIERIEKYFDNVCIDEVQDFGGHDFNLICKLVEANVNQLLVGDFYQHTFDTSRDGAVNKNLHNDFTKYKERFEQSGLVIDNCLLSHSHRCSPTTCEFITQSLAIEINSHRKDNTIIEFVECQQRADDIFNCSDIVKLFYQSSNKYKGFTANWGATKGENNYHDVCVILNATTLKHFNSKTLDKLAPQTKNKLYVACTRTRNSLFFIAESLISKYKDK